jgi:hypothetical protein
MEHEEIRLKLSAYLDNAVNSEEKAEIKRHLGGCGNCRGAIADLDLTIGYIKSLPEIEPPPWLTARILARVPATATSRPGLWQRLFLPLHVKLPIEALILVFLCVAAYFYHVRMTGTQALLPMLSPLPRHAQIPTSVPESPASIQRYSAESHHHAPLPQLDTAPPLVTSIPELEAPPVRPTEQMPEPELQPAGEDSISEREEKQPVMRNEKGTIHSEGKRVEKTPVDEITSGDKVEVALAVGNPAGAAAAIEEAVIRLGGTISGYSYGEQSHLLFIRIDAQKIQDLLARLGRIGTLQGESHFTNRARGSINLNISW